MSTFGTVGNRDKRNKHVLKRHGHTGPLTAVGEGDEHAPFAALPPFERRFKPTVLPARISVEDGRPSSPTGPPTHFEVNNKDFFVGLPRVAWRGDGEMALAELVRSAHAREEVLEEVRRKLAEVGHNSLELDELVVMITRTNADPQHSPGRPGRPPTPPRYEAGLLAFYRTTSSSSRRIDLGFHDKVQPAGDIRLDKHEFPLDLVDCEVINAPPHMPARPPAGMPHLVWHNDGESKVKYIQIRPQQFRHIGDAMRDGRYDEYDVLPEGFLPSSGKLGLPSALNTVFDLVREHLGVSPTEPLARSHRVVAWERELVILRAQVEKDLRAGKDVEITEAMIGTNPLHFFNRLCWTWTGEAYAIFEIVASGEYLVELRLLHTTTPEPIDFGALCGLPIYTNTPPERRSVHENDPVHFRLLGIVQGGNALGTVFLTPLDFLHSALRNALRGKCAGIETLRPVLPAVAPQGSASTGLRAQRQLRKAGGSVQDLHGRLMVHGGSILRKLSPNRAGRQRGDSE
ncbi:hypothetical protein JCM10450v2_004944 [Rhodotorula kratochvilovae]